jgi:hypothetical protein
VGAVVAAHVALAASFAPPPPPASKPLPPIEPLGPPFDSGSNDFVALLPHATNKASKRTPMAIMNRLPAGIIPRSMARRRSQRTRGSASSWKRDQRLGSW